MGDVLAALGWLLGAFALVALLVWGSLRGAITAARARRQGRDEQDDPADR